MGERPARSLPRFRLPRWTEPGVAEKGSNPLTLMRAGRRRVEAERPTITWPRGRRVHGIDVVIVIDDSASTYSSDPERLRVIAAARLVNLLSRRRDRLEDRVGLVRFDQGVTRRVDLADPTSSRGRGELLDAIGRTPTGGGTNVVPALRAAQDMVRGGSGGVLIILLSDSDVLDLPGLVTGTDLANGLHVILLGSTPPPDWTGSAFTFTASDQQLADPVDLEKELVAVFKRAAGFPNEPGKATATGREGSSKAQ